MSTATTPRARGALLTVLAIVLLGALCAPAPVLAVDPTELPDPVLQQRYLAMTHELRCMQCQNETIADSPVSLAADLRREVRDMILAGKSDDEIRAFMVARYGDFILFRPRFTPRNWWLWFAPGILLVLGAAVAVRIVRQRSALLPADDSQPLDEDTASR